MSSDKCRLCGTQSRNTLDIFGPEGIELSMENVLLRHFKFQLSKDDEFSKIVCMKCWRVTDQFHKLYCTVEAYTAKLTDMCTGLVKMDVGEEQEIKEEDNFIDIEPNKCCYTATIKIPDVVQLDSYIIDTIKSEDEASDLKDNISTESDNEEKPPPPSIPRKRKLNQLSQVSKKDGLADNVSKSQMDKVVDKEISEWFELSCDICKSISETFTELKRHFRDKHEGTGYIKCCDRKFTERCRLYEHIQKHKCPDLFKCTVCGKLCEDKRNYKRHFKTHSTMEQPYLCNQCPKRYKSQGHLNKHLRRNHSSSPEQYFCDVCNKRFAGKQALGFHLLRIHVGHTFVCDVCGKVFKALTELNTHNKKTHLGYVSPKFNCTICGMWLSNRKNLQRHTRRIHEGTKEKCDICDKECPNKTSLAQHKRYAHSGLLFPCNICSKNFKSQIRLKEHIGRHMGVNLYQCPHCTKEFISNSDMYKHRKDAHPIEWKRNKEKRFINTESKSDS